MSSRTSVAIEFILANAEQFSAGTYRLNGIELEAMRRMATEYAELLAACEDAVAVLGGPPWHDEPGVKALLDILKAAVSKATGEQP